MPIPSNVEIPELVVYAVYEKYAANSQNRLLLVQTVVGSKSSAFLRGERWNSLFDPLLVLFQQP
jgi:hypothetical protein